MIFPNFTGGTYPDQSWNTDVEECINWYPEAPEVPGAKAPLVLYPTPGATLFGTLSLAPGRGIFAQNGRCFAVGFSSLYELFPDGSWIVRGSGMLVDDAPATLISNGQAGGQLFVSSGTHGYVLDLTSNNFSDVLTGVTSAAFLRGFGLALDVPTSTLKVSNLEDFTTWDSSNVIQRSSYSDNWQEMHVVNGEIRLLGSQTSDTWDPDPTAFPVPFSPNPSGYMQMGAMGAFSAANIDTSLIWLGQNEQGAGQVFLANGYEPTRISTHAVEWQLSQYPRLDDAIGWAYQDQGHAFYVLTFPTANATWVYDLTMGLWHRRGFWNPLTVQYDAWRPLFQASAFGQQLALDRATGNIYALSVAVATDVDGTGIRRLRRCAHLSQEQAFITYQALQIDLQTGIGLASGQGVNPQVMLRWSDDGGNTYGHPVWRTAGAMGQYRRRVRWFPLGRARDRVFEVSVSDPVPWRVQQAFLDLEVGTA